MTPDFWRGRRVFVTGHTGFKGSWLCLLLHRLGARVAGYALAPPTNPSLYEVAQVDDLVESTIADIRDASALQEALQRARPDVVLHLAAQSVVLTSYQDPLDTYACNVMGTAHLLDAIRRTGTRCAVVNVTTDKAYRNREWVWSYRETDELGGRDPYSNSKACAELVAQAYRDSFFPVAEQARHGVALASARAGNVIGGGDWTAYQLVPSIVASFDRGRPVELRHPRAVRPWQHVLDCLAGYIALAEGLSRDPVAGSGEWNFGPMDDEVVEVAGIAETLAAHWGQSPAWTQAPGTFPHEEFQLRLDSSKARRLLRWRPRLSTAEALEWVAQWHRRRRSGAPARQVSVEQVDAFVARATAAG